MAPYPPYNLGRTESKGSLLSPHPTPRGSYQHVGDQLTALREDVAWFLQPTRLQGLADEFGGANEAVLHGQVLGRSVWMNTLIV